MKYVDSECDLTPNSMLKECKFTWEIVQSKDQKEILIKFDFENKA
jgi:hypothetical protein